MKARIRILSIAGSLVWMAYTLLFPIWVGNEYWHPDIDDSPGDISRDANVWSRYQVFSLREPQAPGGPREYSLYGKAKRAAIWSPPTNAPIRWPFQSPHRERHIEIDHDLMMVRWSLGTILLGLIFRGFHRKHPSNKQDEVLSIAWHTSISLVIAWVLLIALGILTMGFIFDVNGVVSGILCFGTLAGLTRGVRVYTKTCSSLKVAEGGSDAPLSGSDQNDGDFIQGSAISMGLLWFLMGTIGGFCVVGVGDLVEPLFPGHLAGYSKFGVWLFNRIDFTVSLVILVLGGLWCGVLIWFGAPRALRIGLVLTTTAIGITSLISIMKIPAGKAEQAHADQSLTRGESISET